MSYFLLQACNLNHFKQLNLTKIKKQREILTTRRGQPQTCTEMKGLLWEKPTIVDVCEWSSELKTNVPSVVLRVIVHSRELLHHLDHINGTVHLDEDLTQEEKTKQKTIWWKLGCSLLLFKIRRSLSPNMTALYAGAYEGLKLLTWKTVIIYKINKTNSGKIKKIDSLMY